MIKPTDFPLDEEQQRKVRTFYGLFSEGKEFYYSPYPDTLYADLNLTMTDKHLAFAMLRHLDAQIADEAKVIMYQDRPKRSKILSIAKLIKGKTVPELDEASEQAMEEVSVPDYVKEQLSMLKPSRLVVFTDTPRETAEIFIRHKIDPMYNDRGDLMSIKLYATELIHDDGVYTGDASFIPDESARHNIQHRDYLHFLKKNYVRLV